MTVWSSEKLSLGDADDEVWRFFARVKDEDDARVKVRDAFAEAKIVEIAETSGEFGIVTEAMSEAEFKAKTEGLNLINRMFTL